MINSSQYQIVLALSRPNLKYNETDFVQKCLKKQDSLEKKTKKKERRSSETTSETKQLTFQLSNEEHKKGESSTEIKRRNRSLL
jgi:uncharacterized protein (DUF2344 family)